MAGPQHNFQGNFANSQQNAMRSQFVGGPQMGGMMGAQQGMVSPQSYGMGTGMPGPGPMGAMPNQGMQSQQMAAQMQQQQIHQQQMLQQQMQQQQMHQQGTPSQMQQQQQQQQAQMAGNAGLPPNTQGGGLAAGQVPGGGQIQPSSEGPQSVGVAQGQGTLGQTQQPPFNTAAMCRYGQEVVQDIVSRMSDLFLLLKNLPLPNGTGPSANASNDKKIKVQEILQAIKFQFKRLAIVYQKCNDNCQLQGLDYMHIESLIPLKEEWDQKSDEKKTSEAYRIACEERREIMEQVILKNKHLKEIIDNMRIIIWEINTLLCMRRS